MKSKNLFVCVILLISSVIMLVSCSEDEAIQDDGSLAITGFSPQEGKVGQEVVIKGRNMGENVHGIAVKFNGVYTKVISVTPSEVVALVPPGSTTGPIGVEGYYKTVSSSQHFTVDNTDDLNFPGLQRLNAISFVLKDKIYVSSGRLSPSKVLKDLWEYNLTTATWTQKADVPNESDGAFCFVLNGKAYMGGGDTIAKSRFWQYDPVTDVWIEKAYFDSEVYEAVSFVINGRAFAGSGDSRFSGGDDFYEYLPETDEWVRRASIPGGNRRGAIGFAVGGKGYIGLGTDDDDQFLKDIYEYDPVADSWIQKADFGDTGLYGAEAFVLNGKAYVGVGHNGSETKRDIWGYTPETDEWSLRGEFTGTGRYRATSFVVNNTAYIGTGHDEVNTFNDFWMFRP